MRDSKDRTSLAGRLFLGVFAGSVFGLIAEVILFDEYELAKSWRIAVGPTIGSICIAAISAIAGDRDLPRWFKLPTIGFLSGFVLTIIVVGAVVGPLMTEAGIFRDKELAIWQRGAVFVGGPIGGFIGMCIGIGVVLTRRETSRQA